MMIGKQDGNRIPVLIADRQPTNSFYSRIRNAAILLKLHGLFPFEKLHSDDGRALSFKWFGWNASWGFLLYAAISIVLYRLSFDKNANR